MALAALVAVGVGNATNKEATKEKQSVKAPSSEPYYTHRYIIDQRPLVCMQRAENRFESAARKRQ